MLIQAHQIWTNHTMSHCSRIEAKDQLMTQRQHENLFKTNTTPCALKVNPDSDHFDMRILIKISTLVDLSYALVGFLLDQVDCTNVIYLLSNFILLEPLFFFLFTPFFYLFIDSLCC